MESPISVKECPVEIDIEDKLVREHIALLKEGMPESFGDFDWTGE